MTTQFRGGRKASVRNRSKHPHLATERRDGHDQDRLNKAEGKRLIKRWRRAS